MRPLAILKHHSNSYPFEERTLDLTSMVKVGRAVAKCKPQADNAIFDCKVLSRNHAVIWFENGKFLIRDTCSSNGTFINNNRLSPANEDSPSKEIHSNDIIQFGVEVVDSANGSEASKAPKMFNIPTANMLPPYYSYTQMLEKEELIYQKLNCIESILEEAHLLADMTLEAKKKEEQLVKQLEELQTTCDGKTDHSQKLEIELTNLRVQLEESNKEIEVTNKIIDERTQRISSLEDQVREKEVVIENLQKHLEGIYYCLIGLLLLFLITRIAACWSTG